MPVDRASLLTCLMKSGKIRQDFLECMDKVVAGISEEKELHIILDNYCIHKRCDDWLQSHPHIQFHYTPTSASWMNQIEIFFGIMSRKTLRGVSYENSKKLAQALEGLYWRLPTIKLLEPFRWRK